MKNISDTIDVKNVAKEFIIQNVGISSLDDDLDIFESGIVNSLFVIQLVTFLEKTFQFKITMDDMDMENFRTINNINDFVMRKSA